MRLRALALTGLSAVLLTACGSSSDDTAADGSSSSAAASSSVSDRTGPELAAAAADALERAGAVRMQGTMAVDGQQGVIDLHLQGADAAGSVTVGGQAVQIILTGGAMYMQGSAELWAAQGVPDQMASGLADTWVLVPGEAGAQFGEFSLTSLAAQLRQPTDSTFQDEVASGELDGRPVWLLTGSDGSATTIAAEGEPYPLRAVKKGADSGEITFSDFGVTQPIEAPAHFLDLSRLGA